LKKRPDTKFNLYVKINLGREVVYYHNKLYNILIDLNYRKGFYIFDVKEKDNMIISLSKIT